MTHWIAQLEVEAEIVLAEGAAPFEYHDPRRGYRVRLQNRSVRPLVETPLLEMQLEFDAPDLKSADALVKPLAREFLYWLSFVTTSGFRPARVERLIDWTPGLTVREQFYYHADTTDMPQTALVADFAATIALFNTNEVPVEVRRAVRWFANGIRAELPDDQFQYFFFVLEILAEFRKSPERVPDRCPKCRGELSCVQCNEVPLHRPYAKQAIRQLIESIVKKGVDEAFTTIDTARNALMHGRSVEELEEELPIPFEELVDRTGRVAWQAIMTSLPLPPGEHRPAMMQATTFLHRSLTVVAHVQMGSKGGDPNHPRLEDQGTMQISVQQRVPQAPNGPSAAPDK